VDGAVAADQTNVRVCVFVSTPIENQLDGWARCGSEMEVGLLQRLEDCGR
jgi:hypothetical protein